MNLYKASVSNIRSFISCQYQYKLKYHDRIKGIKLSNKWTTPGSAVHSAIERYFKIKHKNGFVDYDLLSSIIAEECGNHGVDQSLYREMTVYMKTWANRFSPPNEILELEKEIDMTLPNGIPILGYIDMIGMDSNQIIAYDWKTGNNPYTDDELENDIQAPLYILALNELYPGKKIRFIFDFVKHIQLEYTYTNTQMKSFVRWFSGVINAIKSTDPEKVVPRLGDGCRFCEYRDMCHAMKEACEGGFKFDSLTSGDMDELIKHQQNISGYLSALKDEDDRLKKMIFEKMEDESYSNDSFNVKIVRRKNKNYDIDKVIRAFVKTDHLQDVLSVKTTGISKHIDSLPDHIKSEIEDSMNQTFSNPYLKISKKKGK